MGRQVDLYPVARTTAEAGTVLPSSSTTDFPSSPKVATRAGEIIFIFPAFAKEWKDPSRGTPSSFVRVSQNIE